MEIPLFSPCFASLPLENKPAERLGSIIKLSEFRLNVERKHTLEGCYLIHNMMEVTEIKFQCNEKWVSENPVPASREAVNEFSTSSAPSFVNHAAILWEEDRKKWTENRHQKPPKMPKDPIISWSATYDDLLSTSDPFPQRIPLSEMVDFLVDIWQDEGLFD